MQLRVHAQKRKGRCFKKTEAERFDFSFTILILKRFSCCHDVRPFLDTRGLVNKAKLLFSRILRMLSKSFQQPPLCGVTTPQSHYQPQELVCTTILIRVFVFDELLHPQSKRLAPNLLITLQLCGIKSTDFNDF